MTAVYRPRRKYLSFRLSPPLKLTRPAHPGKSLTRSQLYNFEVIRLSCLLILIQVQNVEAFFYLVFRKQILLFT